MAKFVALQDGIVVNVLVADTQEIAETVTGLNCIEVTDEVRVEIGGSYDGTTFYPAPVQITKQDELLNEENPEVQESLEAPVND